MGSESLLFCFWKLLSVGGLFLSHICMGTTNINSGSLYVGFLLEFPFVCILLYLSTIHSKIMNMYYLCKRKIKK